MSNIVCINRKAQRNYAIIETLESGIELKGSEVKSARLGKMDLSDSFARIENNGVILYNAHISPYEQASYLNVEPKRPRRLLLRRSHIRTLTGRLTQRGLTLVPLRAYFNERGFLKLELALCKGKKLYDKRDDIRRREVDLQVRRALKGRRK